MNDAERMPTENPAIQWRGLARPDQVAQALIDLFDQSGHHHYDEVVTQTSRAFVFLSSAMIASRFS